MTLADLIDKCDKELATEFGHRTEVTCYECRRVFISYKDPDDISDSECCGMDDCCEQDD